VCRDLTDLGVPATLNSNPAGVLTDEGLLCPCWLSRPREELQIAGETARTVGVLG
jgi:hypothetical protein